MQSKMDTTCMLLILTPPLALSSPFLDASSHLYKWFCPSVGPSVTRFFEIRLFAIFSRVKGVDGVQMGEDASIGCIANLFLSFTL